MNQRVKALAEEARKLTPEERLELMAELSAAIADDAPADGTPEEIEQAWIQEVEQRFAARERGETQLIDFDAAMASLKQRLKGL
jgi:hypothetical protein